MVALTFLGGSLAAGSFFVRTDPDFLVHRFQFREKEAAQRKIIEAVYVLGLTKIMIPKARQLGMSTVINLILADAAIWNATPAEKPYMTLDGM